MRRAISATALLFAVLACGPVEYTSMIMKAEVAIEKAERLGAAKYAAREYWRAKAYFDKAREETGRNDFDFAIDYATQAFRDAKRAQEISEDRKEKERKATKSTGGSGTPTTPSPPPGPSAPPR